MLEAVWVSIQVQRVGLILVQSSSQVQIVQLPFKRLGVPKRLLVVTLVIGDANSDAGQVVMVALDLTHRLHVLVRFFVRAIFQLTVVDSGRQRLLMKRIHNRWLIVASLDALGRHLCICYSHMLQVDRVLLSFGPLDAVNQRRNR